jgi:hypothetical protein
LFGTPADVCQGDLLSTASYYLVLDTIIKKTDLRGDVSSKLKQRIAYADSVALIFRTKEALN